MPCHRLRSCCSLCTGWKRKLKGSSARSVCCSPEPSSMRLNDGATYRQTHAHTVWLSRKECIEHAIEVCFVEPISGIAHTHEHTILLVIARANGQFAWAILTLIDCFQTIHD